MALLSYQHMAAWCTPMFTICCCFGVDIVVLGETPPPLASSADPLLAGGLLKTI